MREFQLYSFAVLAVLCFVGSCIMGCASIHYQSPKKSDGTGGEKFSYNRLGLQKIDGFNIIKNEQGVVKVSFTKQEGGEAIAEALSKVSEVALTALKKVP